MKNIEKNKQIKKSIQEISPIKNILHDLNLSLQDYLQALKSVAPKENVN